MGLPDALTWVHSVVWQFRCSHLGVIFVRPRQFHNDRLADALTCAQSGEQDVAGARSWPPRIFRLMPLHNGEAPERSHLHTERCIGVHRCSHLPADFLFSSSHSTMPGLPHALICAQSAAQFAGDFVYSSCIFQLRSFHGARAPGRSHLHAEGWSGVRRCYPSSRSPPWDFLWQ